MNSRYSLLPIILTLLTTFAFAQPRATESGFIQVEEDIRIFYQRFGTERPTVFIPNRLELTAAFAPLFAAHNVVTWDPRGRGLSDRPDDMGRYGIEEEIADAEAIREHFGSEGVTYVGISLWANLAILYAARHPESVERVIALSPLAIQSGLMGPPSDPPQHDLADERAVQAQMEQDGRAESEPYEYCVLSKLLDFADSYADLANMESFLAANVCQYENERNANILPVIFEGIFASFGDWDWRDEAASVTAPVLLVFGSRESFALDGVRAYTSVLPDVGWAELPNAGHHVWNDAADAALPMVDAFLIGEWPDAAQR